MIFLAFVGSLAAHPSNFARLLNITPMDLSRLSWYSIGVTTNSLGHCTKDYIQQLLCIDNRVRALSFDDVESMVSSVNFILRDLYVSEHTLVEFHLTPVNPSNLLWRLLVNIVCNIKTSDTGEILMSRILSLKQFSVLYVEIKHLQFIPHDNNIPTSHTANSEDLCIMCFDAPPNSILPCAHSFCRNCINTWVKSELRLPSSSRVSASNCASEVEWSNRQQCPICRDPCPRSSDAWDVLSEADTRTCKAEMAITVLNLIKNAGSPYKLPQPRQPASPPPTPSAHHP
nr:unnamed protein product [Spirometra erinaceieuropaei]